MALNVYWCITAVWTLVVFIPLRYVQMNANNFILNNSNFTRIHHHHPPHVGSPAKVKSVVYLFCLYKKGLLLNATSERKLIVVTLQKGPMKRC